MATARGMAMKMRSFLTGIRQQATGVLELSETQIIDKVQDQLQHGYGGNNTMLRAYESDDYADYKRTLNPLGVTDLKLTGSFYEHMQLVITGGFFGNDFSIISTDDKYRKLMSMYGTFRPLSLTDESMNKLFITRFQPVFTDLFCAYTGASK